MDLLEKITAAASPEDLGELTTARTTKADTLAAFKAAPGRATKENLDAASEFEQQTLTRLQAKYLPGETAPPEGERFRNRSQALKWLKAEGYSVGQDKFYTDCKAGFPAIHADKSVSRYQVLRYAQQLAGGTRAGAGISEDLAHEKAQLEVDDLRGKVEKRELENRKEDARWLKKDAASIHLAATLGLVYDTLKHHIQIGSTQIAHAAGSEPGRSGEIETAIEDLIDQAFNEIASQTLADIQFGEVAE